MPLSVVGALLLLWTAQSWREPFHLVTFVCELQMFNRQLSRDGVLGDLGFFWIPRQVLKSVSAQSLGALSLSGLPEIIYFCTGVGHPIPVSPICLLTRLFHSRGREGLLFATSPYQIYQNPTFYTSWGSLSFFLLKMNNKILRFHPNGVSRRCLAFYSYLDDRRRQMKPSQN